MGLLSPFPWIRGGTVPGAGVKKLSSELPSPTAPVSPVGTCRVDGRQVVGLLMVSAENRLNRRGCGRAVKYGIRWI